jgi:hypothetical protein
MMAIVVIGGHSRNIGKTSVVCALIADMREQRWTAIKITQCKHDPADGASCDCELGGQAIAISEERDATAPTDSSRYLAAGAVRSLWVRTRSGRLAEAMARIQVEIARAENVMFESNSILGLLEPDVYVSVLDPRVADFKASAFQFLDRADAIVVVSAALESAVWGDFPFAAIERIAKFQVAPPDYRSTDLVAFVANRLKTAARQSG